MTDVSKPLKHATYLLRFTAEEKAELERKVRIAAAEGNTPLTLAHALRMGAHAYLDEFIERVSKPDNHKDGVNDSARPV